MTASYTPQDRDDLRALHMIRDPRDILISGARYHLIAPTVTKNGWHARMPLSVACLTKK